MIRLVLHPFQVLGNVPLNKDRFIVDTKKVWLLVTCFQFLITQPTIAQKGLPNFGLLNSAENLESNLVLSEVPLGLVGFQDMVVIKWTPATAGVLHYSAVPGGGNPANYPSTLSSGDLQVNDNGNIQFLGEKIAAGVHYCIITSGGSYSTEFIIIRESEISPRMISPRSARGAPGIDTNSPVFVWEEVNGVPFYHIFLSDQPFSVSEDEDGGTKTEGANVIWQAILQETTINYGTPDPSGFFTITSPPPLVKGVRYNWIVVNNYGNNPAVSSSVTSGPTGFNVDVTPPFAAPTPIYPEPGDIVTSDVITFQWGQIEGASLYHVYVSRLEELSGSEALLPIWDGVTSNTLLDVSAGVLQQEGTYYWKILAQNESGNGAMTDTTSFFYSASSATANFYTIDLQGKTIPRSTMTLTSQTHGTSPLVLPADTKGFFDRLLPLGAYEVTAAKEGFEDTTLVFELLIEDEVKTVNIPMRASPSSIYGSTKDSGQNPLGFAQIQAVSQSTGENKTTSSDLNGNFSLSLAGDNWLVSASKSGYSSALSRTIFLGAGINLDLDESANGGPFALTRNTYSLSGFVITPGGESIWGGSINAVQTDEQEQATSNSQGQYSVTLGAGDWTITVTKDGYVSPQPETVNILDHNISQNLTLTPKANIISGTITNGAVPTDAATVLAIPNSGQTVSAETNSFGQYTLNLGQGTYQIMPEKTGYISPAPSQFALTAGQTLSGIDFSLEPENSFITGKVTSDGQTPLQGVTVTNGSETTLTGSNGLYTLGVAHGTTTISANKEGYLSSESKEVTLTPGQTLSGINFQLSPNASVITGSIKNGSLAVSDAEVTALAHSSGSRHTAETEQDGSFSLSISAGTYTLKSGKTGFVSEPDSIIVSINPGQTVPNKDFNFIENLSYISGLVKSASTALKNAAVEVIAVEDPEQTFSTVAGVDGSFSLSVLPGFSYTVSAVKTGYFKKSETTTVLSLGETANQTLILQPHQSLIRGAITAQNGEDISSATIQATNASSTFTAQSDATGSYALGVDAGTYELSIQKSGYTPASTELTIGVGDTLSGSDFTLTPNYASLDGVISSSTGETIEGCLVVATESDAGSGGSTYSNAQGHYVIQNLALGVYGVSVTHDSYETASADNQVFAGGSTNRINFTLSPKSGSLEGQVTSSSTGVESVTVTASNSAASTSTVTANDGTYTLDNIAPGTYTVQVSLTGYTSSATSTVEVPANATATANFTVTANEGTISGTLKENGVSISDAQVIAVGAAGNSGFTSSLADGSYAIANLAIDTYKVYVVVQRYISTPDTATVSLAPGEIVNLDFSLTKSEIQISGIVRNQAGSPLTDIRVVAESAKGSAESSTDANGNFNLTQLPTSTQYIVKTDIFDDGYDNGDILQNVAQDDISGITLTLGIHNSRIRGNIGIAEATVTAQNAARGLTYTTSSQPDGSFLLKNLYDGDYQISVFKVGYKVTPSTKAVGALAIAEERTGVDFSMSEIRVTISGQVTDAAGAAVANAVVLAWSVDATAQATTGTDGRYTITNLPPNLTYTVQTKLSQLDFDNASRAVEVAEADISSQDLSVQVHNSTISGHATRSNGEPVAAALVSIVELDSVAYTDSDGFFQFTHLPGSTYTVTVSKEGFETVTPGTVALAQSQTQTVDFSNMTPLTSAIYGVISDTDGRLKNVLVQVKEQATGVVVKKDTTDAGGIYSIQNLEVGKFYSLETTNTGYQKQISTDLDLSAGSVIADFSLEPISNSVYGVVLDKASNQLIAGARVKINGVSGGTWSDSTDSFGKFSVPDLLAATYSVVADKSELISHSRTVNLVAGTAEKMTLSLENPGTIAGMVSYLGAGRAGANITATNSLAGTVITTTSDADGNYAIRGLLNGDYNVSCVTAGFAAEPSPQTATVTAGNTETANFTLTAETNSIIGTVSDPAAQLLPNVKVILWTQSRRDSALSDLNGQFQFTDLQDGAYQVTASLSGYTSPAARAVTLVGGVPSLVDIELTPIINSIAGFVKDGFTASGISGAIVFATDESDSTFNDTTGADGSYQFNMDIPGTFQMQAVKPGYEEATTVEVLLQQGKSVTQDLILTPVFTTVAISGQVLRKGEPIEGATITSSSLSDVTVRDTVFSDASGNYIIADLPAPAEYLLVVNKPGLPEMGSPVLPLTDSDIVYDFVFPSGRFQWLVTTDGTVPLSGVSIQVNRGTQDIRLISDSEGLGQTEDNLTQGEYLVTLKQNLNTILPNSYSLTLPDDSTTFVDDVQLPFLHFPRESVPAKDAHIIEVLALTAPDDTLWLHYKEAGAIGFEKMALNLLAGAGNADTAYYAASIPAQGTPGEIAYFIKTQHQNRAYSNEAAPFTVTVTSEGLLTKLNLNPVEKNVRPGVPVILGAGAYDGVNNLLVPETITWNITSGVGAFEKFSDDSSKVWFISTIDTTSEIQAQVKIGNTTLAATATVVTQSRVLATLSVNAPVVESSNREEINFIYSAADTGAVVMSIFPVWDYQPRSSGQFTPNGTGESAIFKPDSNFIGQVDIFVKDSLTGMQAKFNASKTINSGDVGLKIFQVITQQSPQVEITDGEGFSLVVPEDAVEAGAQLKVKLRKPQIPDVKKFTAKYTVSGEIYDISVSGALKEDKSLTLKLPASAAGANDNLVVGHWDINSLNWNVLQSTRENNTLTVTASEFSEFAVLQLSDPLGLTNIQLLPNPFTPHDLYGLQLGFSLTSNDIRKPWVTVKIYNMNGEHVRTIVENEPMDPIEYLPGGTNTLSWNGLTDKGTLARNGRYIVRITSRDSTGEKEVIKTVVLIK